MIQFGQPKKVHKAPLVLFHRSSRLPGRSKRVKLETRLKNNVNLKKSNPKESAPPRTIYWFEAGVCYLLILLILRFVYPERLANFIVSGSYLPLHLLFFLGNLSLMVAISRSWLLAILFSFGIETLLFFKLQQIQLEWSVVLTIMLPWLIFLGLNLYNNRRRAI
ncbi:MAG TPA: hypothetical protein PKX78_02775 [Candidatus Woesebacteria bacterium]|jgi:hypothetical protein|nr:hypothetical protein [Candidatus Woesebacteria bacterium]